MSKTTAPLTENQFEMILNTFIDRNDVRMVLICLMMEQCMRIQDILDLTIKDVYHLDGSPKSEVVVKESKTGKQQILYIDGELMQKTLIEYYPYIEKQYGDLMFRSSKQKQKQLSQQGVRFILSDFIGVGGIKQCSPHSFRKYGARRMFDNGIPASIIREVLNHSNEAITYRYICIDKDDVKEAKAVLKR